MPHLELRSTVLPQLSRRPGVERPPSTHSNMIMLARDPSGG